MSRRDLSQPSFVDAMVSGYGKVGGFLDRIEQGFDWPAFEALLSPIHGSAMGAPGYPPLTMFKILLLQQWHTLSDPRRRGRRCANRLVVPPLLRPAAVHGDARPRLYLAVSPDDRQARAFGCAIGRGQPAARGARLRHQARHAETRRDHNRRRGERPYPGPAASIPARPGRAVRTQARQDLFRLPKAQSGGRTKGRRSCAAGRDDLGQCPR